MALPPSDPPALALLSAWLTQHTQGELARSLEINQSAVSLWVRGQSRPSGYMREGVELVTGIPAGAWNTRDENRLLARVRRRRSRATATGEQPTAHVQGERPSYTGTEG